MSNTALLVAVAVAVALALIGILLAVTYRFRADRRQLAGGSIIDQAVQDAHEDAAIAQAARVEVGIEAFRVRRKNEQAATPTDLETASE